MKNTVRVIAVVLLICMLGLTLVSCGKKLSGTYSAEVIGSGAEYEFSGSKVTITIKALGAEIASAEGKYSIDDNKITFEFESEDDDVKKYGGTFDFEEGDDYIKIGIVKYDLKK